MNCNRCATPIPDSSHFCSACGADVSGETGAHTQPIEVDSELETRLREDLKDEFVIERELGRGGMAVVFLGHDPHLGRRVAIKVLPLELTFGPGLVERFKREAKTAATLDHPHIIPIHRISTGGKLFWYVMKYVEGESLGDIMHRDGQFALDRAARIIADVADALGYAHEHGVIHRDVKPENVMIDGKGWVTVTDFGIAKAVGTQSLTGSGSMIGTPHYMSPEQCSGRKITPASDQYSLGVMAYQMVTAHLPFTGETVVEIIKKHCMDPVPPLAMLRPSAPPSLIAVVERALAKNPEDRFDTVAGFSAAFSRAVAGEAAQFHLPDERVGPARRRSVTAEVAAPSDAIGWWRRTASRGATRTAAAGVLALVVLSVVLWPRFRSGTQRGVEPTVAAATGRAALPQSSAAAPGAPTVTLGSIAPDTAGAGRGGASLESRIALVGVPEGAITMLDGQRMRRSRFAARPGLRHVVSVALAGFETWVDTVTVREGRDAVRTVRLLPLPQYLAAPPVAAEAAPPPGTPSAAGRAVAAETPGRATPAATATLSVGSNPRSVIYVNGARSPSYPVTNLSVPAGKVHLRFEVVPDSANTWSYEMTVTLDPGEARRLGYVVLRRP